MDFSSSRQLNLMNFELKWYPRE